MLILYKNYIALKRLQSELEIPSNETVEEPDEVLSSTKTTTPSLKKSPKSSDFGMSIKLVCYLLLIFFQNNFRFFCGKTR